MRRPQSNVDEVPNPIDQVLELRERRAEFNTPTIHYDCSDGLRDMFDDG